MKHLLRFCTILVGVTASVVPSSEEDSAEVFNCENQDNDDECHIEGLTLSSARVDGTTFPDFPLLRLDNFTCNYFSPELTGKVHNSTENLLILDGFVPKVHLKPTLKALTDLRAGTTEVVIDPEDNHRLELLDVEGHLRVVPDNVHRLKNLVTLDLCKNRIESLNFNQLEGLNRLRKVNLGRNQISSASISNEVILPSLEELFLQDNRLETLDLTNLKADRLARLYLSQNRLVSVGGGFPERYRQLQRVDLYGNEWDCEWLKRTLGVLRAAGVETMSYLPTASKVCDETGSVRMSEEFHCLMKV